MKFNFFKDFFKNKKQFITRPLFIEEFVGNDELKRYSLSEDLIFFNGKENIIIPAIANNETFITNLASLPKWLHWLIKPDNKYIRYPSALHDGLYDNKTLYTRVYSDWMFLVALKSEKCPIILRWTFFLGVRIFGSSYR